jgi:cation diffusion facilitator CzcD-associated flavoprotein CzcO
VAVGADEHSTLSGQPVGVDAKVASERGAGARNCAAKVTHTAAAGGAGDPAAADPVARTWLARFAELVESGDLSDAAGLFRPDASWRDIVSLTWDIRSVAGEAGIADMLRRCREQVRPGSIRVSSVWLPLQQVRAEREVIEVLLEFETGVGHGEGVVRLSLDSGSPRAWTVLTALRELTACPERAGVSRPYNDDFTSHFGAPNWLDQRQSRVSDGSREPAVLIVGAGQAGLTLAARLGALGIDALVVERSPRVGDNWRNRYHSLWLHNEVDLSHLPYLPFPATWPAYISKDQMASWLEHYADVLEINVWTDTRLAGAVWESANQRWTATVESSGATRILRPRHVVMATGVSAAQRRPDIPGLADFGGQILHSSEFTGAEAFRGQRAVVFGVSNSGSDIAQDLHAVGCEVTMVQRGSITVVSHNPGSLLLFALYRQGWPTEVCDLINIANPGPASIESHQAATRRVRELDRDLIAGLNSVGFQTDYGPDETGFGMKYFRHGGGHYLNIGCSELLIDRKIGLLQYDEIARVVPGGLELRSGEMREASLIVLATGYHNLSTEVGRCFGTEIAGRVGPIWGLDDEGELRNMWRPTAQPGLWFHAGSLYQCRVFSRYLAVQIAARELRLAGQA